MAEEKKKRWYHNLAEAYRVTKKTYRHIGILLMGAPVILFAICILIGIIWGKLWVYLLTALFLSLICDMLILSILVRKAIFTQIKGKPGAVYAALSDIRRGWIIEEQPIAMNKNQDIVWRIVGRPGIVLITEGSSLSRANVLANKSRADSRRIVANAPIHIINVGEGKNQIKLKDLKKTLTKLSPKLTKQEVPMVAERLRAVGTKGLGIPKGIDPNKVKAPSRKSLRG